MFDLDSSMVLHIPTHLVSAVDPISQFVDQQLTLNKLESVVYLDNSTVSVIGTKSRISG